MKGPIKFLFLDIGGVLLTNGWDHNLRKKVAEEFQIDYDEMTDRHRLIFDTFETGKSTFDDYLNTIIFYEKRSFTLEQLKSFIFNSAHAYPEMIEYVKEMKAKFDLKIAVVSNEGKELAFDRVKRFKMRDYIDFFIISSFVHFRKPDHDIYRLALDVAQAAPSEVCYIDDRKLLIEEASKLGIFGIHHHNIEETKKILNELAFEKASV